MAKTPVLLQKRRYSVSCNITELTENGEIQKGGYEGDLEFELRTSGPPTTVLIQTLANSDLEASQYCT